MTLYRCILVRLVTATAIGWALLVSHPIAHAIPETTRDSRPKINLFPTSVVESLSETSRAAREMESGMLAVVDKLDRQTQAYKGTQCEQSKDAGCLQLRKAIRGTYKDMLR